MKFNVVTDLSNSFHPVPKPLQKNKTVEKSAEIKKKSKKLAKLESRRFSIITNNLDKCYVCGAKKQQIHEIYKGRNRQVSMKYGFCIPICDKCHKETELNSKLDKKLKEECQRIYEKKHTRKEFLVLIGKNYIKE